MIDAKLQLDQIQDADNIADFLAEDELNRVGHDVVETYLRDKESRRGWEKKNQQASDLALQVVKDKTFPWPGASNVKFPLLTTSALQFQARAYPALVKAPNAVKMRVTGADPDGAKAARASRVGSHMSYQLLEKDESWEEGQDKLMLVVPILGCAFKKTYWDENRRHMCSKLVFPKDLVVHYYAKDLETAERVTEVFELSPRIIRERELRGLYTKNEYGPAPMPTPKEEDKDEHTPPPVDDDQPRVFLEQHRYLDLDGDGYKEPYVVTVDLHSKKVARIVARFDEITTEQALEIERIEAQMKALAESLPQPEGGDPNAVMAAMQQAQRIEPTLLAMERRKQELGAEPPKVLRITPLQYFTKYSFIPSPDGSFYDLGFGALLGPLNDSVNTLINQILDSGTLQNSQTGFVGRGARMKGGRIRFSPYEWVKVDVAGGQLKDNLVPLPVNPPSPVLFNMLSLLIQYAERLGSSTDILTGENPGQNTPAYNMSAMLEQGLQVFNGIFKRIYRSFRSEVRKVYKLNAIYLPEKEYFQYHDGDEFVYRSDYGGDPSDLIPAADPSAFSNQEKMVKAQMVAERAMMSPGYNPIEVEMRMLEALDIPDIQAVFPLQQVEEKDEQGNVTGTKMDYVFPPQPDPEFEIKRQEEQRRTLESQTRSEVQYMNAEADMILKTAQAEKLQDQKAIDRLTLLAKELESKRKYLADIEKANATKQRADRRVD